MAWQCVVGQGFVVNEELEIGGSVKLAVTSARLWGSYGGYRFCCIAPCMPPMPCTHLTLRRSSPKCLCVYVCVCACVRACVCVCVVGGGESITQQERLNQCACPSLEDSLRPVHGSAMLAFRFFFRVGIRTPTLHTRGTP
jgi:hypothetical protein